MFVFWVLATWVTKPWPHDKQESAPGHCPSNPSILHLSGARGGFSWVFFVGAEVLHQEAPRRPGTSGRGPRAQHRLLAGDGDQASPHARRAGARRLHTPRPPQTFQSCPLAGHPVPGPPRKLPHARLQKGRGWGAPSPVPRSLQRRRGPPGRGAPTPGPCLPRGLPAAAHREGDIPDAAHGVAVISRVDSPGEDLMQMHLWSPGWTAECARGATSPAPGSLPAARAVSNPPPSEPSPRRLGLNASLGFCLPPASPLLPWEVLGCRRRRPVAARLWKYPDASTACCTGAQMLEERQGSV